MTKNPFYNAFFAISYIVCLVTGFNLVANGLEGVIQETILLPMGALGVLVFSVALMAYLFFFHPLMMILDGKRHEGVQLFLQTVTIFALMTVVVILAAFGVGYALK